jgi:hypothetical protein
MIDRFADVVGLVGRHRAPPGMHVQQLTALIEIGGSGCPSWRIHTDRDSGEVK